MNNWGVLIRYYFPYILVSLIVSEILESAKLPFLPHIFLYIYIYIYIYTDVYPVYIKLKELLTIFTNTILCNNILIHYIHIFQPRRIGNKKCVSYINYLILKRIK